MRSWKSTRPTSFGPSRSSRMSRTSRVNEIMRAVKGNLGYSFKKMFRELEVSLSMATHHNVKPGGSRLLGFLGTVSARMLNV